MANRVKDLTCTICGNLYTKPVFLPSCGHTFDRHCILRYTYCPIPHCRSPVVHNQVLPNYALQNLTSDHHFGPRTAYEIFLLDTSTSMWYSDSFLGLFGPGRFQLAVQFLRGVFEERLHKPVSKVSFITFDAAVTEQHSFNYVGQEYIHTLSKLKPNGAQTALFDAIKFCLKKFETLHEITQYPSQYLYILTDGGDNFSESGNKRHYVDFVKKNTRKFNIHGHIIQIGSKNVRNTMNLCHEIDYRFHFFKPSDLSQFSRSFLLMTENTLPADPQSIPALPRVAAAPTPTPTHPQREKVAVMV